MGRSWIVRKVEWWKHLRYLKRTQNKRERQGAKKNIRKEL